MFIETKEHGIIELITCKAFDKELQEYKPKLSRWDKVYLDRIEKITGKRPKLTKRS